MKSSKAKIADKSAKRRTKPSSSPKRAPSKTEGKAHGKRDQHVEAPVEEQAPKMSTLDRAIYGRLRSMGWGRSRRQILSAFALGDALGARFEQNQHEAHPALRAIGRRSLSLFDSPSGPTSQPAPVTDDTILTMGLAKHLLEIVSENKSCVIPYEPWQDIEKNPNRGWGGSIKKADEQSGPVISSGCGSLMRCAPIAMLGEHYRDEDVRGRFFWRVVNAQVSTTHLGFEHVAWSWIYVMLLHKRITTSLEGGILTVFDFRRELQKLKNKVLNDYVTDGYKMEVCELLSEKPEGSPSNISVMAHSVFETIEQLLSTSYPEIKTLNDVATEAILRGGDCDTRAALVCAFFADLPSPDFEFLEMGHQLIVLETRLEAATKKLGGARS